MFRPACRLAIRLIRRSVFLLIAVCSTLLVIIFLVKNVRVELQKGNEGDQAEGIVTFESLVSRKHKFTLASKDLMILLHIQKTGGTSFERHLVHDLRIHPPCSCSDTRRRCACLRVEGGREGNRSIADSTWLISRFSTGWVCGLHPSWATLKRCLVKLNGLHFLTFLRDPVTRFVSEFRHVQRGATWKASKSRCKIHDMQLCYGDRENWANVSLEEFLDCPNNMATNRQTRMLADEDSIPCEHSNDDNAINSSSASLMLSSALENLRKMAFFGLCELQRASQVVFEETFKMRFNQNFIQSEDDRTRALVRQLPEHLLVRIRELNHLDLKLYNYAMKLFKSRCKQLTGSDTCQRV